MAPIKRSFSADPAPIASYQWQNSPPASPNKAASRPTAKLGAAMLKRAGIAPLGKLIAQQPTNPACSLCRVGRSVDDAIVVCERCSDWSHAACAGTGTEAHYLCSRCCQVSTTEEDLSPEDSTDIKEYAMSGAHSVPTSISNSPIMYPISQPNGEYAVGTVAPANLHDAEATYICPVCDIDCTCENKQQARRNSIYAGPVDIFDKPNGKGTPRKNSNTPLASTASSPVGGVAPAAGAFKRQRTMSNQTDETIAAARKEGSPTKKEDRIIACTQDGCDKVYTTMAGLRYHLKTFDHQKNKRKDSIDGSGSTAASAAPSNAPSPTPSGTSPTSAALAPTSAASSSSQRPASPGGATTGANGVLSNLGGFPGASLGLRDDPTSAASSSLPSSETTRPQTATAAAHDALDAMVAGDMLNRRSSLQVNSAALIARRSSYFSESEDDSYDEDDEDDEAGFTTHSAFLSRRHSYPGTYTGQSTTPPTTSSSSGGKNSGSRRPFLFESTPSTSSPIFCPVSPQMNPLDAPASFSLDFCQPLLASISGEFPAEWDF